MLDLATRKIVGWAEQPRVPAMRSIVGKAAEGMRDHMRTELPLAALMMAAQRQRPAEGLICHSDRGSQYASNDYTDLLKAHGCQISMSQKASPWENAGAESWMKTLKYEEVYRQEYRDLAEARSSIERFIDRVYNQRRLHSALGYLPPVEFEALLMQRNKDAAPRQLPL